ncbi:MAG: transcription-repair coupling factor, partial [Sandarakinorhabdus sp.]|nr:transcription-repair coupling factor [Sandarakinorhabdus sp.]
MADAARAAFNKDGSLRAGGGRAVFIAADDASARSLAEAATYFAPEIDVITLPAWDCLPYDRASPGLRVAAERLAALSALEAAPKGAQLVVTTINAVTQRTLPPARIAALTAFIKPGTRIDRDALARKLAANGYVRTDTVVEAGEYAVRGSLLDLMPAGSGGGDTPWALRLDFFGDEIETVRKFDPATQRTLGSAEGFTLLPVSEVLLDETRVRNFRTGYLDRFGATATG